MIIRKDNRTIELRDHLIWDISHDQIDPYKNSFIIIERVLNRGNKSEFEQVVNFYGVEYFLSIVKEIKTLDAKTKNLLTLIFDIKFD